MPRRRFEGLEEGLIEQEIRERGIKRIEQELLAVSEWLKEQGFPVTQEGRIDPSQYTAIGIKQKEINNDQKIIKGAVEGAQIFRVGEQLERLKTIILNREFQGKIFFVRTSLYDDVVNKVDNLIIGPNNEIVCAIDLVADLGSEILRKKQRRLEEKKYRTRIKYGLRRNEKGVVRLEKNINTPSLILYYPPEKIEALVRAYGKKEDVLEKKTTTVCQQLEREFFVSLVGILLIELASIEVSQTREIIKQQIFNQLSEQEKQQIIKAIDILPEGKKRRVREFLGLSS